MTNTKNLIRGSKPELNKFIQIADNSVNINFTSDESLITRIIFNMIKNALEASDNNDKITIGCTVIDDEIEFWVHNPKFIPYNVQLQIFQRSFSTKGIGRGIGTYSIKLLTEKYLKGKAYFTSKLDEGTRFCTRFPLNF